MSSPTDIEAAIRLGLKSLGFFPAQVCGGSAALITFEASGYYEDVDFIPFGGITLENSSETLPPYLACRNVLAIGCQWKAPIGILSPEDAERAGREAAALLSIVRENRDGRDRMDSKDAFDVGGLDIDPVVDVSELQ